MVNGNHSKSKELLETRPGRSTECYKYHEKNLLKRFVVSVKAHVGFSGTVVNMKYLFQSDSCYEAFRRQLKNKVCVDIDVFEIAFYDQNDRIHYIRDDESLKQAMTTHGVRQPTSSGYTSELIVVLCFRKNDYEFLCEHYHHQLFGDFDFPLPSPCECEILGSRIEKLPDSRNIAESQSPEFLEVLLRFDKVLEYEEQRLLEAYQIFNLESKNFSICGLMCVEQCSFCDGYMNVMDDPM